MLTLPKSNSRFGWTTHIKNKMVYYHISQAQIMRIFRSPERREEGIAPGTIAAMRVIKHKTAPTDKKFSTKKAETEAWLMYKVANSKWPMANGKNYKPSAIGYRPLKSKITLISAWHYPGRTKPGERPALPIGLLEELTAEGLL